MFATSCFDVSLTRIQIVRQARHLQLLGHLDARPGSSSLPPRQRAADRTTLCLTGLLGALAIDETFRSRGSSRACSSSSATRGIALFQSPCVASHQRICCRAAAAASVACSNALMHHAHQPERRSLPASSALLPVTQFGEVLRRAHPFRAWPPLSFVDLRWTLSICACSLSACAESCRCALVRLSACVVDFISCAKLRQLVAQHHHDPLETAKVRRKPVAICHHSGICDANFCFST